MKLRTPALLLLLVSFPGCKPEDAALRTDLFSAGCAQLFSCGCSDYEFVDAAQCEQIYAVQYAGVVGSAEAAGLTVDEGCLQKDNFYITLACKKPSDLPDEPVTPAECSYCSLAHGTVALDQPCVDYGDLSDCAQGLLCFDGVCVDPCAKLKAGESCGYAFDNCEDGLFCDFDNVCAKVAAEGEPCDGPPCADGLVCAYDLMTESGECRTPRGQGQDCSGNDCAAGLVCSLDSGTCESLPGDGEPCDFSDCADGLVCDYDTATNTTLCGPVPKVGEDCTSTCEDGALCSFDGFCIAEPGAGQPCYQSLCAPGLECGEMEVCVAEQAQVCY